MMSAFLARVLLLLNITAAFVLAQSGTRHYYRPVYFGRKGQKGSQGRPGICPTLCGNSCEFGARGVLQEAMADGTDILSIDALREAVERGNRTAMALERNRVSIDKLSDADANSVYTYLLFRNGVCDNSLLLSGLDPPTVVKGQKGQKGARGARGAKGEKGDIGTDGQEGPVGPKGDAGMKGDPGLKGDIGPPGMKGAKGEPGMEGDVGIPGPMGPPGSVGASGAFGPPGRPGVQGSKGDMGTSGVTYINWGEETCPPPAITLYSGSAVRTLNPGGLLQCLRDDVFLHTFSVPLQHTSFLQAVAYTDINGAHSTIRCAMCYAPAKTAKFVNLGTTACPTDWTTEYEGALATQHYQLYSDGVCINTSMASQIQWNGTGYGGNDLDLVAMECATGSCPSGQVSCALCTR